VLSRRTRDLPRSRHQPDQDQSGVLRLSLDARQQCLRYAAAARDIAHVHSLYFGEVREQCHSATPRRGAVQARQEEPHTGLEDCLQSQTMPLFRRVFRREGLIEFRNQAAHIVCCRQHQLDRNFVNGAHQLPRERQLT